MEVVHAVAENAALPSTSWRARSKEAFGGEGAPVMADFGQTDFGQLFDRLCQLWA